MIGGNGNAFSKARIPDSRSVARIGIPFMMTRLGVRFLTIYGIVSNSIKRHSLTVWIKFCFSSTVVHAPNKPTQRRV